MARITRRAPRREARAGIQCFLVRVTLEWSFDRRLSGPIAEVFFDIADWLALRATRISVSLTPRVDLISLAVALSATILPVRKPFGGGGFFAGPSEVFAAERLIEALYSYSIDSLLSADRRLGFVRATPWAAGRSLQTVPFLSLPLSPAH
jgi:hypothetical protein